MTSKLQKFRVLRDHDGDRFYLPGDIREANPSEVAHLVGKVLEPAKDAGEWDGEAAKAEPTPKNKAEGAAPANKASGRRKSPAVKTKG
ncbi:MAG TPA: hypothetical protein VGV17_03040 [Bosea sp. (in: a-proteobacteria)]|jgi:hypothetical protein|uniref:hypothetical protein n=1 Tax=Bosea sp. (in: a-proteobacteria) TaxID=1871050 RepID=UPI002DDCF7F5|nr:hypothetical protein [Bosea sp. (in: a-proteobacteria)]HEV2552721.1 hypothetical protein [Bosea sp. (in: a-proteobacteria)]